MRSKERVKRKLITFLTDKVLRILILFPNKIISKIIFLNKKEEIRYLFTKQLSVNSAFDLIRRIYQDSSPKCKKKLLECFIVNQYVIGKAKRENYEKKTGIPVPINLLISVTSQCNLNCKYCYGPKNKNKIELPLELIDKVVTEGKDLGTYWNVISGGEPFLRKDLFKIFEKHKDVGFTVFTNGLQVNTKLAKKLARLGNVMPAISLEGFKEKTDFRRGKGIFKKIINAMSILKKHGVPFAYSITVTKDNVDEVSKKDFIKMLIDKGAILGFYLPYIPTGQHINIKNLIPPDRKIEFGKQLSDLRKKLPIFIDDFQHKSKEKIGCKGIWGKHLHINVYGDITPCISTNFASDNIKDISLEKALRSKFLKNIRNIKSLRNGSKPCLILHNPLILERIIKESKAYPTEINAERIYTDFSDVAKKYSKDYEKRILNEK